MQRFLKFVAALSLLFCTSIIAFIIIIGDETGNLFASKEQDEVPVASTETRKYVVVSGAAFGIRLYSDGILIVGTAPVFSSSGSLNPAYDAGIEIGDVIKAINGRRVTRNSDLSDVVKESKGEEIELLIKRDNDTMVVKFTPVLSAEDGKYKAGLWVRDSTAGIGTVTYFDPDNLTFAGLGHGICDVDTGEIMPLFGGDAVYAEIADVYKGSASETGELCGVFREEVMGPLLKNTTCGVFGSVTGNEIRGILMPVAEKYEVEIGKAEIISTIDGDTTQRFDIEITRLYLKDDGTKGMAIKVTDEELTKATGGIIQGMSGSPIIQNGMLVGAVTHVLVDDPTKGYGIFAQTMLDAAG